MTFDILATKRFALRRLYTRREIADVVGGDLQSFLPHQNGKVVAACVGLEQNPDAPHVILVGNNPDVEKWGRVLANQTECVPVFIKRATNAWQYVGDYRVRTQSDDPDEIGRWEAVSGREGELSRVLYLAVEDG